MATNNDLTLQGLLGWKAQMRSQNYKETTISRKLHGALASWRTLYRNGLVPNPPPETAEVDIPKKRHAQKDSLNQVQFLHFALTPPTPPDSPYAHLHLRDEAMLILKSVLPISSCSKTTSYFYNLITVIQVVA